jgi:hypothetical protein
MSDLERALRSAFALDAGAAAGPGFEARLVRAARARGRVRVVPIALSAAVAGAAIATLLLGGRGDEPSRAALDAPELAPQASAPPRAGGGDGSASFSEMWEIVIRFGRSWIAHHEVSGEQEPRPEPPEPAREQRRPRQHRGARPAIDCGNDPLCPLVAPTAARLHIATARGAQRVTIDGQDAGTPPLDIEVIPGIHRIVVHFAGGRARSMSVDLGPGERRTLTVSHPDRPR